MRKVRLDDALQKEVIEFLNLVHARDFATSARIEDCDFSFLSPVPTKSVTLVGERFKYHFQGGNGTPELPPALVVKRYLTETERTSENSVKSCADESAMERAVLEKEISHNCQELGEVSVYPRLLSRHVSEGQYLCREFIPGKTLAEIAEETDSESSKWEKLSPVIRRISLLHTKGPLVLGHMAVQPPEFNGDTMFLGLVRYIQRILRSTGQKVEEREITDKLSAARIIFNNFDDRRLWTVINGDLDTYLDHVMPDRLLDAGGTVRAHFIRDLGLFGDFRVKDVPDLNRKIREEYRRCEEIWASALATEPRMKLLDDARFYLDSCIDNFWGCLRTGASKINYQAPYVGVKGGPSKKEFHELVGNHLEMASVHLAHAFDSAPAEYKPAIKLVQDFIQEYGLRKESYEIRDTSSSNPGVKLIKGNSWRDRVMGLLTKPLSLII